MSAGPAVQASARPPNRLFRLVLEPHDGRALVHSEEKREPVSDVETDQWMA